MKRDNHFIVEVQEDVSTGDLVLPIPEQILNEMGWYEGTELDMVVDGGELIIREVS